MTSTTGTTGTLTRVAFDAPSDASSMVFALRAMPMVIARARLQLERKPVWEKAGGTSLATSLRGLLLRTIVERACATGGACAKTTPLNCEQPQSCQAPWLLCPRSEAQKRDHAPPITLHVDRSDENGLALRLVLWGHRAGSAQLAVWTALADAGHRGLIDNHGRVRWRVQADHLTSQTVGVLCQALPVDGLWLGIDELQNRQAFDLPRQFGNLAHDLTQFALADDGQDATLAKTGCDAQADAARVAVEHGFRDIDCQWHQAGTGTQGERYSRRNAGRLHLTGVSGLASLHGKLRPLLPWLVLASHWGLAGRKSFGQGRIHLWADDGTVWPQPRTD